MKKLVPSLIGVCLAVDAVAQQPAGFLGTKVAGSATDTGASASGPGIGSFVQMVLALGIVLILLKTVIPKLAGKLNKRLVTSATSTLTIEETANFAGGNLYIVRARSKTLLISASSAGVTCLSDITDAPTNTVEVPTFQEIVEQSEPLNIEKIAAENPETHPWPDTNVPTKRAKFSEETSPIEIALQRIERLAR